MDAPGFPPPQLDEPQWVALTSPRHDVGRRHRRRGAIVAVALVGLATAGAVTMVASRDEPVHAFSLNAATAQAQRSSTISYTAEIWTNDVAMTADFSIDMDRKLMAMHTSAGSIGEPVDVVFDLSENTMYVDASAYGGLGADLGDVEWIEFDIGEAMGGIDMAAMFDQIEGTNPLDVVDMFAAADDVEDLGYDEVRGERVKHYAITVDMAAALAGRPDFADALAGMVAEMPDTVVFDAYVNGSDELVRFAYDLSVGSQQSSIDLTVTGVGDDVDIELLDPSTVIGFDDQMG